MRRRNSKKKKLFIILFTIVACLGIGYAFLNATLNINGTAKINNNTWDIHFINLQVNSNSVDLSTGDSAAVINPSNNTEVTYTVTLQKPGDFYEFTVDAKNFGTIDGMIESVSSKLNGVEISSTNPLPVYLDYSVTYDDDLPIDNNHLLAAGSQLTYKVHLEYKRDIDISDLPNSVQNETLSFGITTIQADENATHVRATTLKKACSAYDEFNAIYDWILPFHGEDYAEKIKTITLDDEINPPSSPVASWDIGAAENGDVMAYLTVNADDNTMYDLYIQGDGHLYANRDSSYLFADLLNVSAINNLDVLDISRTTDMSGMFINLGVLSDSFTLDLGNNFDTSNVTNMYQMFTNVGSGCSYFTLDLGEKFDTSNVTNMSRMFSQVGYGSTSLTLDLGEKFDTSNVTDMSGMFSYTGTQCTSLSFDLGEKFDTSNVTNMNSMFSGFGMNANTFTLDLGNKFDTSKVTKMEAMFYYAGRNSQTCILLLRDKFDTSKVTDMSSMFTGVGYNCTTFTLDLGNKFDTSNVIDMGYMFNDTGYKSTVFSLDLGNRFNTSKVTDMQAMFDQTGYRNTNFTLNLGNKFYTSNVTNMNSMFYGTANANNNFELDLSSFDFSNVQQFSYMFNNWKSTQIIYVKDAADQTWIIGKGVNVPFSTSNVLIKGV